jgi:hypothetical protein
LRKKAICEPNVSFVSNPAQISLKHSSQLTNKTTLATSKNVHICFNMDKNQLSRQTGSRNLMVPKTLPTIWYTYVKLVTKYQISILILNLEEKNLAGQEKKIYFDDIFTV